MSLPVLQAGTRSPTRSPHTAGWRARELRADAYEPWQRSGRSDEVKPGTDLPSRPAFLPRRPELPGRLYPPQRSGPAARSRPTTLLAPTPPGKTPLGATAPRWAPSCPAATGPQPPPSHHGRRRAPSAAEGAAGGSGEDTGQRRRTGRIGRREGGGAGAPRGTLTPVTVTAASEKESSRGRL